MKILGVTSGTYGQRIVKNLLDNGPAGWEVAEWRAPAAYPIVMDDPSDFIPRQLDPADLILALGEHPAIAELIPEICKLTGAKAVIVPIDRNEWLPKGLANQLQRWLLEIGVTAVFPKPFCSLSKTSYSLRGQKVEYKNELISEFAQYFGKPQFRAGVHEGVIATIEIERASPCGCSIFVARGLETGDVNNAVFVAGMLHHHFPCLASMGIDPDYGDTLMHVSGNITCDAISSAIKQFKQIAYFKPM